MFIFIIICSISFSFDFKVYANQTIRTNRHIEVAPNTIISFINSFEKGVLAKAVYFRAQPPQ